MQRPNSLGGTNVSFPADTPCKAQSHDRSSLRICESFRHPDFLAPHDKRPFEQAGFRIERQDIGGPFVPVGTVGVDSTGFVDEPLTTNVDLCWQVVAYNSAGDSSSSNVACASAVTPPGAPSNLTVIVEIVVPPPGLGLPSNFVYGDGPWYDSVDTLPLDPQSASIIAAWEARP